MVQTHNSNKDSESKLKIFYAQYSSKMFSHDQIMDV